MGVITDLVEAAPMILSEEQIAIRNLARDFARRQLQPNSAQRDREGHFPKAALSQMGEMGFMGMLVPEQYGGAGLDHVSYVLALEEVAYGDGSCSTIMGVQNSVVCMPILRFGTAAQKERFLPPLARGTMLGAFCLTEAQAGSDAAAIRTRAVRVGQRWVINGAKQFITSGANAEVAIVFAVTDPEAGRHGISAFIVPTATPGWKVVRVENKLGQHASDTAQLAFEDLAVTSDLLLGGEGEGYRIALSNLEGGRIGIGAQAVGMALAAYETALDYASERETFGRKIIDHQAVAFRLADMATEIEAAWQLVLHAASLRDSGQTCIREASMAKLFASEMAERVCSRALQTFGGNGYLEDYPVARIYRNVRACQIYEGTSDIQRLVIARHLRDTH